MIEEISEEMNLSKSYVTQKDFEFIYDNFFDRVFKFVSYRVSNREDSKDVTSEIFQKIYKSIDKFDSNKSKLEVWIFAIARNTVTDYYRSNSKHKVISIDSFKDFFASEKYVEDDLEKKEEYDFLRDELKKLNSNEQLVISYKFGAELSNIDIAELTGMSSSNVAVVLHRSIKKLRSRMEAYYE
ncbi:RNA polymerase sigma-70 factor, ECF subfamily [Anaerosphaera aminiphila DSM 21120]|uniref:RNA polymerase sigma-70 factor, ECF subfamily n=1 Tax=Anaerosphaera aminiphila DSM 21120 TaxID=1120995 RepID=A0A1M5TAF5_9FIRM|nr:sigma-70 family RNA polymerase sigma factor [Anaerosphaera aminiphila]SHH47712.1 RNA polymerase sigma-70 factor, ECF subfamily [Anaerosphaera aminiphila DSM 21120]